MCGICIYKWTRWRTRWGPAQFRRVGRYRLNRTRIDSSGLLTTRTRTRSDGPGPLLTLYGGYERTWEIRGTTCLIGYRRPRISDITRRIGTRTCRIGDGQLTRTRNSLSPSFSWWFPPSPLILSRLCSTLPSPKNTKLSHPSLSHHAIIMS